MSLSAHLEMLQGCSVRSFQVVIRTCVLGAVPSLFPRGFELMSDGELRKFWGISLYSGTGKWF